MIATTHTARGYEVIDASGYVETQQAEPTNRVLDGSSDHGYAAEYIGRGTVDGVPVMAVYLLSDEDMGGAGDYDLDAALSNGRVIVDVDALTEDQYAALIRQ